MQIYLSRPSEVPHPLLSGTIRTGPGNLRYTERPDRHRTEKPNTSDLEVSYFSRYEVRAKRLYAKALEAVPSASIKVQVGRKGAFEVVVNGMKVFSKLEMGYFPKIERVVEEIRAVANGIRPKKLTEKEDTSNCPVS
ncbi:Migration and invasion enhancer 1 [Clonorchis sinensis]|uniref:Migration and invasion enhancer 1 n=1 Tax=Clonorchis sinensis TaxID=79923 RepID=A0A8T1MWD8_CLOSI|nr:Migration and invasion enhancer 1 [Clonorchis sinensis]